VVTFDVQQTLPTPFLISHSQSFFQRQLWAYDRFHVGSTDDGYMVIWSEGEGKRGSCKVGTGILKVINLLKERKILPVKGLIFWCDGCCGQNKNFFTVCLWSHIVLRGFTKKVRHRFLISGRTFLPNDRDFAQIQKRKHTKISEVHVPFDWFDVVQTSRTSNPFHVIATTRQDIYDLSASSAG
jgi:hypothetical protein